MPAQPPPIPSPIVAVAGWVIPGAGYWLIGQRARAVTVFCAIVLLFLAGLLIAGVRCVDVPGYNDQGQPVLVATKVDPAGNVIELRSGSPGYRWDPADNATARWSLLAHPFSELLNKPWYIGQFFAGPMTLVCSKLSIDLSKPAPDNPDTPVAPKAHVRIGEIGTLYTAVAGMLNLLVIIDAAHRASRRDDEDAPHAEVAAA